MTDVTKPVVQKDEDKLPEEKTDEQVRAEVVEKYGLDEESQGELIDGLVKETQENRKVLSTAIQQKVNWRKQAETPGGEDTPPGGGGEDEAQKQFDARYAARKKQEESEAREANKPIAVNKLLADFPDLDDEANWDAFKKEADKLNLDSSVDGIYGQLSIVARGLGYQSKEPVQNSGMGPSNSVTKPEPTTDDDVKAKAAEIKARANEKVRKIAAQYSAGEDAYYEALAKAEIARANKKEDRYI